MTRIWSNRRCAGALAAALLAAAGCAGPDEAATRRAPWPFAGGESAAVAASVQRQARFHVQAVEVRVPETLKVSEANLFHPIADIVWRGEPRGDRHAQVRAILAAAGAQAAGQLKTGAAARVTIELTHFHGLTEKAAAVTGGVHAVRFRLTVTDPVTGAVLDGPRMVKADLADWGGGDHSGDRQKLVAHIAAVLVEELSIPISGQIGRAHV
jgi:hypothetical protein